MKRVVFINYTLNFGGAERYISHLANFMSKHNIQVFIILLDNSPIKYDLDENIKIIQPSKDRPKSIWPKFFYFIYIVNYLRKSIKKINPSLILNTAFPVFILAIINRSLPIYVSIRCDPKNISLIEGFEIPNFVRKIFYKKANGIIAQTIYAKDTISKQLNHKNVITIPNFLVESEEIQVDKKNEIVFVGRLVKSKGVDFLIRAFSKLKKNNWKLIIVGDGPQKKSLESLVLNLNMNHKIIFKGNQKEVSSYYKRARIFAFPSLTEGFPNALLEAMSYGLACVSFDCVSGPSEIIQDGINGFLVENGNELALVEKLNLLIENEVLRNKISQEAIYVRKKYNIETIGKKYINILSKF